MPYRALLPPRCCAADTTKVRATFPQASAIAEEVSGGSGGCLPACLRAAACLRQRVPPAPPTPPLLLPCRPCLAQPQPLVPATPPASAPLWIVELACPWCKPPCTAPLVPQLLKTEYDTVRLLYNRFVSAISQKPTIATVLSPDVSRRQPTPPPPPPYSLASFVPAARPPAAAAAVCQRAC